VLQVKKPIYKSLRDILVVIVEKIQLFVLFFLKTVDITPKGDYYYTIVILHVYFARVAKGVGEFLGKKIILNKRSNIMKKLIALFGATTLASTGAIAGIALSGSASVTYDDNGGSASTTTYDADMTMTGTSGGTTLTWSADIDGGATASSHKMSTTAVDLSSTIGPVTIAADMHDEISAATTTTSGGQVYESTDTSVTVSLDVPIGDATVGLDNSGNVILSGTFSGVTVSHTVGDTTVTTASAAIAGVDMSITNSGGSTTWTLDTTVSGVDLTLTSGQKITAAFGLAGNTMTVTHVPKVSEVAAKTGDSEGGGTNGYGKYKVNSVKAYSTVAISRDLTSGATLTATYSSKDDSLTLKAAVTF